MHDGSTKEEEQEEVIFLKIEAALQFAIVLNKHWHIINIIVSSIYFEHERRDSAIKNAEYFLNKFQPYGYPQECKVFNEFYSIVSSIYIQNKKKQKKKQQKTLFSKTFIW